MVVKIKTDVDRLVFVLRVKQNVPVYFAKIKLFLKFRNQKQSVFIFYTISQILKRKFYVFQTQICRNLKSIKFPKYHMPLILKNVSIIYQCFVNIIELSVNITRMSGKVKRNFCIYLPTSLIFKENCEIVLKNL